MGGIGIQTTTRHLRLILEIMSNGRKMNPLSGCVEIFMALRNDLRLSRLSVPLRPLLFWRPL
jgi:hypothetical protein